jgi:hypothetical protein
VLLEPWTLGAGPDARSALAPGLTWEAAWCTLVTGGAAAIACTGADLALHAPA